MYGIHCKDTWRIYVLVTQLCCVQVDINDFLFARKDWTFWWLLHVYYHILFILSLYDTMWLYIYIYTLLGTNISPWEVNFQDDFPLPKVGYVSSLEGKCYMFKNINFNDVWIYVRMMPPMHERLDTWSSLMRPVFSGWRQVDPWVVYPPGN